jgi:starch synthase
LLKTGLTFADAVTTVSPRYAQEIQTPDFGAGLEGVLQYRRSVLEGILNGIDAETWNPAADPFLAATYSADTWRTCKPACKAALQREMGLPERAETPLIGFIGRMVQQKGIDLLAKLLPEWAGRTDVQWVILGNGDPKYHKQFERLAQQHPERIAVRLGFSDELAHRIEAGADMFVMPSRYEPCGLNQMYSLRYGTVPIVRDTGGLADTVVDCTVETLAAGTANGFRFREDRSQALEEAIERALHAYRDAQVWPQLVTTGMRQDWSWDRSAREYAALYEKTLARRRPAVTT